jgi:hypothetical protein
MVLNSASQHTPNQDPDSHTSSNKTVHSEGRWTLRLRFRPVQTLVDITSNTYYKCTATFRTQICRKCLRIKLKGFRPVQTLVDITSNTYCRCNTTFRTQCIILTLQFATVGVWFHDHLLLEYDHQICHLCPSLPRHFPDSKITIYKGKPPWRLAVNETVPPISMLKHSIDNTRRPTTLNLISRLRLSTLN